MSNLEILLSMFKGTSVGIPIEQVVKESRERGVKHPLPEIRKMVNQKLLRIDKGHNGHPDRIKATNKIWGKDVDQRLD